MVVWAATTRDEDYVRMVGWRRVVGDVAHRKEVVAGNLGEYASSRMLSAGLQAHILNFFLLGRVQEGIGQGRGQSKRVHGVAAMGAHPTGLQLVELVRRPVPAHSACASVTRHVFLCDAKQNRIAVPPFTFATFDKPLFKEDGITPTYAVQTLQMQFGAPPQAGSYTFVMHMVCDSYIGTDTKLEVTLTVEDASKAAEFEEEEEISEPDEGKFLSFCTEEVNA